MSKRISIRITDEMDEQMKQTGYTASDYGRMAIEKQLCATPQELLTQEQILLHDIERYEEDIEYMTNKLLQSKKELEEIQSKISNCEQLSNKIKTSKVENKEEIEHVLLTVRNMIKRHEEVERRIEYKTTLRLNNDTMKLFAKKTGLRKDELKELFEKYNLQVKVLD